MDEDKIKELARILLEERRQKALGSRNERLKQILLLLAGGAALATALVAPGTIKLFRNFVTNDSDWKEWKNFNVNYLRRTLRKLESQKMIKVTENGGIGKVVLTEHGRRKIMEMNIETMFIRKPEKWDGKWRMVFYDVVDQRRVTRDKFRKYLLAGGFYPWQKSVYLHAYPCEKEIEFLRDFLGIGGEVRVVLADKIENDRQFRDYFGV